MNTVRICIDHCLVRRGSALLIDWICFEIEFPLFWKWLFCEFIHSKNGMAFSRESHWFSFIICNTDWSIMGESISYYRVPYNNITDYSPVLIANCGNYIYWRACIRGWGLGVWLQCQKSWLPKCLLQVIPLTCTMVNLTIYSVFLLQYHKFDFGVPKLLPLQPLVLFLSYIQFKRNILLIKLWISWIIRKNPLKHEHAHEENDSTAIPRRKPSHAFITITNPKKLRSAFHKKPCRQTMIMRAYVSTVNFCFQLFKTCFSLLSVLFAVLWK